jgi:threonine synthase
MPTLKDMNAAIQGYSFTDEETRAAIKEVHEKYNYTLDPHGAVAYLGLTEYKKSNSEKINGIFLETAHPAKFPDTVEAVIGEKITMPEKLKRFAAMEKKSILISNQFYDLKALLLEQ